MDPTILIENPHYILLWGLFAIAAVIVVSKVGK